MEKKNKQIFDKKFFQQNVKKICVCRKKFAILQNIRTEDIKSNKLKD
jgi:hypothetical protein